MPGPINNKRREAFCILITGLVDEGKLSQGQAYLDSGYKAKSLEVATAAASRMLRDVNIDARLAELRAGRGKAAQKVLDKYAVTTDRIVRQLARVGFCDPGAYVKTVEGGEVFKDIGELSEDERAAIKLVRMPDGSMRAELRDPAPALVRLGQHMGMFSGEDAGSAPPPPQQNLTINDNRTNVFISRPPPVTREQWIADRKRAISGTVVEHSEVGASTGPPNGRHRGNGH